MGKRYVLGFVVSEQEKIRIRIIAAHKNIPMSELIRIWIKEKLKEEDGKIINLNTSCENG